MSTYLDEILIRNFFAVMWSRTLFVARKWAQPMQKRGMAAIKNWKRPSMDEMPEPCMPFSQANAKAQAKNNMQLVIGTSALAAAIFVGYSSGAFTLRFTPVELLPPKN